MTLRELIESLEEIERDFGGEIRVCIRHDQWNYGEIPAPRVSSEFPAIGGEGEPIVIFEDDSEEEDAA